MRRSRDVHANVASLSPRNFGEFTMRNFRDTRTNVVRVSHDGRETVLRQHAKNSRLSGEKIKLSVIRTNVVRHSHECRATVVRIKMKIRYIRGKVVRHSHECRATVVRQSHDYRATVVRYIFKITVYKLASDNGFSQKIFVWGMTEKIFSCHNLDLSLS